MEEMQVENSEMLQERYELARERISEIPGESVGHPALDAYFGAMAAFVQKLCGYYAFMNGGTAAQAELEQLQAWNHDLYEDILPEHYGQSWGNPAYAVEQLGEQWGQLLSYVYVQLREGIVPAAEGDLEEVVIRLELLVEIYSAASEEWQEQKQQPFYAAIRQIVYWHNSDYSDIRAEKSIRRMVCPEGNPAVKLILGADLEDIRYLYRYGLYVTENEIETARFLAGLPQETIDTMADTYTEGYRLGFEVTGKDLSKKKTADIYYHIGFERMIRRAIENLDKLGLQAVIYESVVDGGTVNRQYGYDHKDDMALYLDKNYVNRRLEVYHTAMEKYKEEAAVYAGPAVVETFGEADFNPVNKPENLKLSEEQNGLWVEYRTKRKELQKKYIKEEERSFTIISFPVPEVGPVFRELFDETIKLNTLDYMLYRNVQQKLIDALDTADYCEIKGCGDNRTDLKINLWKLQNPEKETIFENCVADVNIPVGEVFTSPVLEGTNGILHVTKVFLNGLEYRNLAITLEEGMIRDYSCDNFETEEENRNFIKENILFRHETLPIGEFAIGTNTTAYVMARKLKVEAKLPILIAEKTGPHFAMGDTCYSGAEDVKVYNPDGKEIVAKDNSKSRLRQTNPTEAYFSCHTDITIPYDELGELTAVRKDGTRIAIIKNGRFVLPGTEVLNEAFED